MTAEKFVKKRNWRKELIEAYANWSKDVHEGALTVSRIIVGAIDEDPANRDVLYKALKNVMTRTMFHQLESVGRKVLDPRLLIGSGGQHTSRIKRLPFDLQKKIIDGCMFEFLTTDGSHMMVCLRDCEDWQAKQMFADDHIRTLPEQKSWAESEKAKRKSSEIERVVPYEIRAKDVLFKEMTSLTFEEIRQLALQCH
jgi:hypothetical protein